MAPSPILVPKKSELLRGWKKSPSKFIISWKSRSPGPVGPRACMTELKMEMRDGGEDDNDADEI